MESVPYFSIFVPKPRCSLKKKNYFLQLIIVTVLKFLTSLKFFISLPEKFWFCPNIFLSLPEKFEFRPNLGNLAGQLTSLPPPPGTDMVWITTALVSFWSRCLPFLQKKNKKHNICLLINSLRWQL